MVSLQDYASRHFEKYKRPLRIAVDGAGWRFTNVTPEQARRIHEGEPAANPVEKVILWRILRLLKLNVQLLFVNDGTRKPWKRNKRGGNKKDWDLIRLTRQVLDALRVPHHEAPGEAEAECARLQALGVVDAVWSDDGDSLMFGCTTLIRQHKVGKERIKDYIRVHEAKALLDKHDLDSHSLVLFAILAGGDYHTEGLPSCGPQTAALLAKTGVGLSHKLRDSSQAALPLWREELQANLDRYRKAIAVPSDFPQWKPLEYYRKPTVSTDEQLRNLRGIQQWNRPIDESKLRTLLRQRFNFTTREYMKHIAPIFLIRRLLKVDPHSKDANLELGINLRRTRKKKEAENDAHTRDEAKITFSPMPVVGIDLSQQPLDEDWTKFAAKDGTPYDPTQNVECEVLHCFLEHGLPRGSLESAPLAKRKRAIDESSSTPSTPAKKRKNMSGTQRDGSPNVLESGTKAKKTKTVPHNQKNGAQHVSNSVTSVTNASTSGTRKKRGRPKKQLEEATGRNDSSGLVASTRQLDEPTVAVFRQPQALLDLRASIIDHSGEEQPFKGSHKSPTVDRTVRSGPVRDMTRSKDLNTLTTETGLTPGESISPDMLRKLRATAFLDRTPFAGGSPTTAPRHELTASSGPSSGPGGCEVIDLT